LIDGGDNLEALLEGQIDELVTQSTLNKEGYKSTQ
jgi:hypothetical protein